MKPNWSKFDRELQIIYTNYLELKKINDFNGVWIHSALKNNNQTIFLTLQYTGELAEIEKTGFKLQSIEKTGIANGLVNIDDLDELSQLPTVLKLSYGDDIEPYLDSSVLEILARGTTPGTNCVWSVNQANGTFSGMTGENVIIGIIDTGIEWLHQNFMKHDNNETRILSIWDPGLVPQGGETGPNVALLTGGPTYGVEYTESMINAELSVYANDWFLIPFTLPIGTLATIKGMSVTNTFGERFWIEASGSGNDNNWQRWNMFNLKTKGSNLSKADTGILLAPSSIKVQESNPLEEVCLIRDEMANMVWGLETTVPTPNGYGQNGNEAGLQIRQFHENLINNGLNVGTDPFKAKISYLAMTSVPENWIPFVPVHKANDNRETQLQRSSMIRIIEGDTAKPIKVKPKTGILRHGLDETPPNAFYLHEEEVPRAGVRVSQAFQRTRWTNGEVFTWLGMQKYTGRGEGNSGLAFDQIVDVKE